MSFFDSSFQIKQKEIEDKIILMSKKKFSLKYHRKIEKRKIENHVIKK